MPITNGSRPNETSNLLRPGFNVTVKGFFMQLIRFNSSNQPNNVSMTVVGVLITCYCIVSLTLALFISYGIESIAAGETWALATLISLVVILLIFCLLVSIQPRQIITSRIKPFMVRIFHILIKFLLNKFLLGPNSSISPSNQCFHQHLSDAHARLLHMDSFWHLDVAW